MRKRLRTMESAEEGECTAERRIGGGKGTIKKKNFEDEEYEDGWR